MRVFSGFWRWLTSWFPFGRRWAAYLVDDAPENLSSQTVYLGAGSVVTKDAPAGVVVAGNPGRVIRHIDEPPTS